MQLHGQLIRAYPEFGRFRCLVLWVCCDAFQHPHDDIEVGTFLQLQNDSIWMSYILQAVQHRLWNYLQTCAWVLVNQFHFFIPLSPPLLLYAQPNLDLSLAWRTHFHDFLICFGVRHDIAYFINDHSKSKVLGCMTAQHLIFILTSLVPRPPRPAFVACSTKSGGRPGRIYHMMRATADVTYCS